MVTGKRTDLSRYLAEEALLGDKHLGVSVHEDRFIIHINAGPEQSDRFFSIAKHELVSEEYFGKKGADFRQVDIYSNSRFVTLVPEGLFKEAKRELIHQQVFGLMRSSEIHSSPINALDAIAVFDMDKEVMKDLDKCFPQRRIKHSILPVLTQSLTDQQFADEHLFRIHMVKHKLFLSVFKGKRLCFFNTYHCPEATDTVYHVINCMHTLEVDHSSAKVRVSGTATEDSSAFRLLKDYCPAIEYLIGDASLIGAAEFALSNYRYCE